MPGNTTGVNTEDDATFNGTTNLLVEPDEGRTIDYLTFGGDAGEYTIGGSHTLLLYSGRIIGNNTSTITFDAPLRFLGDNYVSPATGQTFNFNGDMTVDAGRTLLLNTNGTLNINGEVFSSSGSPTVANPVNFRFLSRAPTVHFNHANTHRVHLTFDAGANGTAHLDVANVVVSDEGGAAGINIGGGGSVYAHAAHAITGTSANVKVGSGYNASRSSFMRIDAAQSYEGDTIIGQASNPVGKTADRSILLVNNASGSGTGNSDITVHTGILGGNGFITNTDVKGVTVTAGGVLSPGASAGTIGTLTMDLGDVGLDISAAVAGSATQALLFDLDTILNSDRIALLSDTILHIGNGGLEFDDFVFTAAGELGAGTYTLVDTCAPIDGTLGVNVEGLIASQSATLSLSNDGQDILLNVIPEPASLALLAMGGVMALGRRRAV